MPAAINWADRDRIHDQMLAWTSARYKAALKRWDSGDHTRPDEGEELTWDGWGNADLLDQMMASDRAMKASMARDAARGR